MANIPRRELVQLLLGSCAVGAGCTQKSPALPQPPPSGGTPPPSGGTTPPPPPTDNVAPQVNPLALDANLKRGPYVQLGSEASILVVWQTFMPVECSLEYGPTPDMGTRVSAGPAGTSHAVTLDALEPQTRYYYRLFVDDAPLTQVLHFSTNHRAESGNFKFLVIGDSGVGTREQLRIASLVNGSSAAFGLHTGDIIYVFGEESGYDPLYFYPYAPFLSRSVMYATLGNHDALTNGGEPYFRNFHLPTNDQLGNEAFYSFDYSNVHVICLNTMDYSGISSNQRRWLIRDLQKTRKPWKFVFFHFPPYTAGYLDDGDGRIPLDTASVRENLVPVFEQYGVDIVFSGHSHSYERTFPLLGGQVVDRDAEPVYSNPQGPLYIVTGGGGARLLHLDSSPLNASAVLAHHLVEISIDGNDLIGRAIGISGQTLDQFQIRKDVGVV